MLVYAALWSVITSPGIERFPLRNLWKDAGGRGCSLDWDGSSIDRFTEAPNLDNVLNIVLV